MTLLCRLWSRPREWVLEDLREMREPPALCKAGHCVRTTAGIQSMRSIAASYKDVAFCPIFNCRSMSMSKLDSVLDLHISHVLITLGSNLFPQPTSPTRHCEPT